MLAADVYASVFDAGVATLTLTSSMAENGVRKPDSEALDSFVDNGVNAASALMAWKGAHSTEPSELEEETKVLSEFADCAVAASAAVMSGGLSAGAFVSGCGNFIAAGACRGQPRPTSPDAR